jgi:PAS domain S-box-containing protein
MTIDDVARLIVEHSPDALIMLDQEGVVRWWNQAATRIYGFEAGEALGRPIRELLMPLGATPDDAREEWASREVMHRRKDGTMIHVRCSQRIQRDSDGRVLHRVFSVSDLTAVRVMLDANLLRARYHDLLESLPDAAVVVNDSGRIVLFNAQATALFWHSASAALGHPIEMLLPERLRAQHLPQRTAYLQAPRLRPMGRGLELLGLRADGSEFPVEISLSPIEIDGRRMVMSAIRDISDRKRIERALQEKNLELERASNAKDRFLATMSHELRTPLNAILGFTGILLMRLPGPLTDKQEHQLQHVQSSGQHLLSLINDLLDLAKIESGRVELEREAVEGLPVAEAVAAALRPLAQARGLTLDVAASVPGLRALGDRRAIHQVLLNLANNALKFTETGGVAIEVAAAERDGAPAVTFSVLDTGVGIAPEDLQRLFQAFVQVGDGERRSEGTGLGLHLSRKLAELMGGKLTAHSELGHGSRFTLTLTQAR